MFELYAEKNRLTVTKREMMTSGSVNAYKARFTFSTDWDGLDKTVIFRAGDTSKPMLLEVLAVPMLTVYTGVYGTRGEDIVLPTVWASMGQVLHGTDAPDGEGTRPPTPDLWEQTVERLDREISGKGDTLDYTDDGRLGLYSGDKLISAVPVQGGGGEGGTPDHRALSHRDAEGQHPIEAITGLSDRLGKTMTTDNALTVSEILKIMEVT